MCKVGGIKHVNMRRIIDTRTQTNEDTCTKARKRLAYQPIFLGMMTCADPESFVRGGPILTSFFFVLFLMDEGR